LPELKQALPELQFLHLTGSRDEARVRSAYAAAGCRAVVRAFLTEMDLALGSARAAVTRAGASSAAELAAVRLPSVLVPYPYAADGHQEANARALEKSGAARVLGQAEATPARLAPMVVELVRDEAVRSALMDGLAGWHRVDADAALAEDMLSIACGIPRTRGTGESRSVNPLPA
jgi:UDP-N-acetylglucosamine--N-acetylmuramyl-(pentapeptide) pyrophosphoryl-undecaprenol N-acetylglucosamine transferase